MKKYGYIWLVAVSVCVLSGCSPRALDEAQRTVAQADSLRAEGGMYTDSLRMAQAYETLYAWRACYADDYAHACYHYGRLLRDRDNPVAAMQCFIAATHCRTRDYHILGRVYSNMGSIAHLAGEYSLSYDMFERSAEMFLREKDSLAYYYGLNNMAFELAEQGKKEETLSLLACIEANSTDNYLSVKIWETKAVAYLCFKQYDSVVYYTNYSLSLGYKEPTSLMVRAQAFSHLSQKDSATYYAQQVINKSGALSDINNALYILTNEDETKDKVSIRETASNRADVQKLLETRQGKLSQATQLLEQDRNHKPNLGWLYAIIATLGIIGTGIAIYVLRKRKKHQLLSQQIEEHQEILQTIQNQEHSQYQRKVQEIEQVCSTILNTQDWRRETSWKNYSQLCEFIDKQFYFFAYKLKEKNILNEKEIRLCILVLIGGFSDKQMADILCYGEKSIRGIKRHTAQKLGTTSANLRVFMLSMILGAQINR